MPSAICELNTLKTQKKLPLVTDSSASQKLLSQSDAEAIPGPQNSVFGYQPSRSKKPDKLKKYQLLSGRSNI